MLKLFNTLCVKKNSRDIFDCNFKKDYQIIIIFDRNISYANGHQMIV